MKDIPHTPVLLNEVLASFQTIQPGNFVDCTLGYAGHSFAMLQSYPNIGLIGIDRDDEALEFSAKRLEAFANRTTLLKGSFSQRLQDINFSRVTGVLADFGVSSLQLDKTERGFNFESDTLDMRMDQSASLSAFDVVNHYPQEMLEKIFKEFGEVREFRKVASLIVNQRAKQPIASNKELAALISSAVSKKGKIHPATLYFQAIRIEVNKELEEIVSLLDILEQKKPKNTLIALITFHSLEDRLVKRRFKQWSKSCICPSNAMRCSCGNNNHLGSELSRKPIVASKEEIAKNPRSRSAKLRVFQFKA